MIALAALGVLGGISLYFGGIVMQKVRSFQNSAEGLRIATVIASYHDETRFSPAMRADCREDIHDNSEAFIDAVTDVLGDGSFYVRREAYQETERANLGFGEATHFLCEGMRNFKSNVATYD